jgi:hypothetical protein
MLESPSILTDADFRNPAKFVRVASLPVFDEHRHRTKGNVGLRDLQLLVKNTNDRVAIGHPPILLVGHTCDDDLPEDRQPVSVGVALDFRLGQHDGRHAILCDFLVQRDRLRFASSFPYRSIERIVSDDPKWNVIPAIALLRREPDRKLGMTKWPDC